MNGAYSILWVGSIGASGHDGRSMSDWDILQQLYGAIPRRWQHTVLAGRELLESLSKCSDSSHFSHLSLFGDAALTVISGQSLPAVEALHVEAVDSKSHLRKRVLLPVDESDHGIEAARLLCRHIDIENAEIHLLYVHPRHQQTSERRQDINNSSCMDAEAGLVSQPIFAKFVRELARYGLRADHHIVRYGDPAEEILEYATQIHAGLIVMGSTASTEIDVLG